MTKIEELNKLLTEYNCVIDFCLNVEPDSFKYNLFLSISKPSNECGDTLRLCFYDVANLNLLGFGGGLSQFVDLKIKKDDRGYDRVNYSICCLEDDNLHFNFFSVEQL
jgi:hypothetical protein